jgi:hypothetical protein
LPEHRLSQRFAVYRLGGLPVRDDRTGSPPDFSGIFLLMKMPTINTRDPPESRSGIPTDRE